MPYPPHPPSSPLSPSAPPLLLFLLSLLIRICCLSEGIIKKSCVGTTRREQNWDGKTFGNSEKEISGLSSRSGEEWFLDVFQLKIINKCYGNTYIIDILITMCRDFLLLIKQTFQLHSKTNTLTFVLVARELRKNLAGGEKTKWTKNKRFTRWGETKAQGAKTASFCK